MVYVPTPITFRWHSIFGASLCGGRSRLSPEVLRYMLRPKARCSESEICSELFKPRQLSTIVCSDMLLSFCPVVG
jgi:hypothetical protein